MQLAVFDLDHTLLADDSDHLWGEYLVECGLVDAATYAAENERFYGHYKAGTLDIHAYIAFALQSLLQYPLEQMLTLRERFAESRIAPIVAAGAPALLQQHRDRGDTIVITTATNRFVTEPIARLLGVEHLIATDPEQIGGRYTGRIAGTPNFQGGKVTRLRAWIDAQADPCEHMTCYSDSHNDLPLLEMADLAVAVDPDPTLRAAAEHRGWGIISLR